MCGCNQNVSLMNGGASSSPNPINSTSTNASANAMASANSLTTQQEDSWWKNFINDGTANNTVDVAENIWGSFFKKGKKTNQSAEANAPSPTQENKNTGLYIGIGIAVILGVMGIIYFAKNKG